MFNPVTVAANVAQGAANLADALSNTVSGAQSLLGGLSGGSFFEQLRPASYRGVPFVTLGGSTQVGRRNAVHEYPLRDTVWVEDLGRMPRRLQVQGFLIGDDVIAQRERLIAACESPEGGQLVHPTLGRLQVSVMGVEFVEHRDHGRVFEVQFTFIEAGQRIFPAAQTDTRNLVSLAAGNANLAAAADFVKTAISALQSGSQVVAAAVAVASTWTQATLGFVRGVSGLVNLVVTLPGSFGRLLGSLASGFTQFGQSGAPNPAVTLQSLKGQAAQARAATQAAASAVTQGAGALSAASASAYPGTVQAFAATVAQTAATPAAALQALLFMATPIAAPSTPPGAVGSAMGAVQTASNALFRRAAVVALAQAASQYQPASANDAASVRTTVTGALDAELTAAGDAGDDATFVALQALRAAVVQDLNARGAALPSVVPIVSATALPALTLAQRQYRDASRADELIAEADPRHPAFMPTRFLGLSR